jgi:hypothetical protein
MIYRYATTITFRLWKIPRRPPVVASWVSAGEVG